MVARAVRSSSGDNGTIRPTLTIGKVTLDLGTLPEYIVEQINEEDTYEPAESNELVTTDIVLSHQGSQTRVLVPARLTRPESGDIVNDDGVAPHVIKGLSIVTNVYEVSGTVTNVGGSDIFTTAQGDVSSRRPSTYLPQRQSSR